MIEEIDNNFVRGKDEYPGSITSAYNLMINYREYKLKVKKDKNNNNSNEQTTLVLYKERRLYGIPVERKAIFHLIVQRRKQIIIR